MKIFRFVDWHTEEMCGFGNVGNIGMSPRICGFAFEDFTCPPLLKFIFLFFNLEKKYGWQGLIVDPHLADYQPGLLTYRKVYEPSRNNTHRGKLWTLTLPTTSQAS
jgi:hypothetical protein